MKQTSLVTDFVNFSHGIIWFGSTVSTTMSGMKEFVGKVCEKYPALILLAMQDGPTNEHASLHRSI